MRRSSLSLLFRHSPAACAVVCLTAGVAGCTRPPTSPSIQTVRFTGTIDVGFFGPTHDIIVSRDGTAVATLTWTNTQARLDVELTESSCGVFCKVYVSSTGQDGRVRQVTKTVKAGERYGVEVLNQTHMVPTSYALEVLVQ